MPACDKRCTFCYISVEKSTQWILLCELLSRNNIALSKLKLCYPRHCLVLFITLLLDMSVLAIFT